MRKEIITRLFDSNDVEVFEGDMIEIVGYNLHIVGKVLMIRSNYIKLLCEDNYILNHHIKEGSKCQLSIVDCSCYNMIKLD